MSEGSSSSSSCQVRGGVRVRVAKFVPKMSPESLPKGDHYEYGHRLELGTQNAHMEELANNHRAVGVSSRKCRVAAIRIHSPISLTLPLSSPKADGFATTPARGRRLPVRASVIYTCLHPSDRRAALLVGLFERALVLCCSRCTCLHPSVRRAGCSPPAGLLQLC